jgi:predicted Zn-dependent protease
VSEGLGQTVSVRLGEVETIEYNQDKGVSVTVYLGQKKDTPVPRIFQIKPCRTP